MGRKKRYIKLTESEVIELEQCRKTGKQNTFRQRCHYILLSNQGKSVDEISEIYQVGRNSVTNWYNRYESSGITGLHTTKGQGRPAIICIENQSEVAQIEKWVEQHAQNLKPVLAEIDQKLGKKMVKRTLTRLLKKKSGDGNDSVSQFPKNQQKLRKQRQ